jgi:hypothetical protein
MVISLTNKQWNLDRQNGDYKNQGLRIMNHETYRLGSKDGDANYILPILGPVFGQWFCITPCMKPGVTACSE